MEPTMAQPMDDGDMGSPPPDDPSRVDSDDASPRKGGKAQSEREKRTYRACLHCRQRKSRCDLYGSGEPGRPPCERCIREQHECILGGSRRGGKRVKRSHSDAVSPTQQAAQPGSLESLLHAPPPAPQQQQQQQQQQNAPVQWRMNNPSDAKGFPSWAESRSLPPPTGDSSAAQSATPSKMTVDESATVDLQNPADALEFLANVAERNASVTQLPPMSAIAGLAQGIPRDDNYARTGINIEYPPLQNGGISIESVYHLLRRYRAKYNPYFPICNPAAMEPSNIQTIAKDEPHLLAAILTVASKDERQWWQLHEVCSAHMQTLVGSLAYSGTATVEAVEAMLILAEWVPRRSKATPAIGKGEEDQAAWMLVGTAIRLGYLLGIDRTGFRTEYDSDSANLNRGRLAWAACYMCDRQISIRLGKAFWSRGPGPMTSLQARDFPSLQPRPDRTDDFAAIFQANLELTQLFSNAHDVLYATKSRSNQLNYGGEYVKYIDDFRVSLRSWHATWGSLQCSPEIKASLNLSYEYLRLYINAFAYQATLNRLVARMQEATASGQRAPLYPFADVAATPDARFVYEAIEAAKAILTTFTSSVDPIETFRFMPLRYYLYVIYSATFLYKARSTGVMAGDNRDSVKALIAETVERLQKASACANDVGERYARLIRLLWRRPPGRKPGPDAQNPAKTQPHGAAPTPASMPRDFGSSGVLASTPQLSSRGHPSVQSSQTSHSHSQQSANAPQQQHVYPASALHPAPPPPDASAQPPPPSINTFSWLDLPAVGEFATNNNNGSVAGSGNGLDLDFFLDDGSMDGFMPGEFGFEGLADAQAVGGAGGAGAGAGHAGSWWGGGSGGTGMVGGMTGQGGGMGLIF